MKLGSQLYLLAFVVVLYSFCASLANNITSMKSYLDDQLASHAQDAANNLGLAITPYLDEPGLVVAQTMSNAVFDSGYYYSLELVRSDGEVLLKNSNPFELEGVPFWFLHVIKLSPPIMQSEVNSGWLPFGVLNIQSHPGKAYRALWQHFKQSLWASALQFVFVLVVSFLFIRAITSTLRSIETQANRISKKQFVLNEVKPYSRDLAAVVHAINFMANNIRRSFSEHTASNESLIREAYIDNLTGLPNRRSASQHFTNQQALREQHDSRFLLFLITLPSLKEVNETEGYGGGDEYVKQAIRHVQSAMKNILEVVVFRLSGSELCVSVLDPICQPINIQKQLLEHFNVEQSSRYPNGFAHFVYVDVKRGEVFSTVLSHLDNGLTQKLFIPTDPAKIHQQMVSSSRSRLQWQKLLHQYIQKDEVLGLNNKDDGFSHIDARMFVQYTLKLKALLKISTQPIFDREQKTLYEETFVRFIDGAEQVPVHEVFAAAERLGLANALERTVVTFIISQLLLNPNKMVRYGINISNFVLQDLQFIDWLIELLSHFKDELPLLVFEINESAVLASTEHAKILISELKRLNFSVVIERFGSSFVSFKYIKNLNIDYVKLDGAFIDDIAQSDTQFYIQSTTDICHGIGIKVIASHIESKESQQLCRGFNLDGFQGFALQGLSQFK
ncbi:EAL domain-containing protein [Marinicellulosiphila megalodicopiae]|uniref:EAL domain-containing protein n=1 Tax=Marinicellulosiphila megalodicopiae TaxID=2724896 RepID=UPI003BB1BE65